MLFCFKFAQERAESEKLRQKIKTLQERLKQQKQKTEEEGEDGPGTEKPVVEEVIREDRVRLNTLPA